MASVLQSKHSKFRQHDEWFFKKKSHLDDTWSKWECARNAEGRQGNKTTYQKRYVKKTQRHETKRDKSLMWTRDWIWTWTANRGSHLNTREKWRNSKTHGSTYMKYLQSDLFTVSKISWISTCIWCVHIIEHSVCKSVSDLTVTQKLIGFPSADTCAPMRMTFNVLQDIALLLGAKDKHTHTHTLALCHSTDHAEQHNNRPPEGGERGVTRTEEEGAKVTKEMKKRQRMTTQDRNRKGEGGWRLWVDGWGGEFLSCSPTFLFPLYSHWCGWLWSAAPRPSPPLPPRPRLRRLRTGLSPLAPF